MKFRTRIIVVYAVFALSVAILLGGIYYYFSVKRSVDQEFGNLEDLSRQLNQQYEESIKAMKNVSSYILSDADVIEAIRKLSVFPKDADYMSLYFSEAAREVRSGLNTDYIISNFYRVIFFNQNGVVLSSIDEDKKMDTTVNIDHLPWIEKMETVEYGEFGVFGLHEDDWGMKKEKVFSVVKDIQGENLGYIEVQKAEKDLENLLTSSNPDTKILLMDEDGTILYSTMAYNGDEGYGKFLTQEDLSAKRYKNTVTGRDEFLAGCRSKESGTVLLAAKRYETVSEQFHYIFVITLALAGSFIGIAILYIAVVSNHLTKPMQELKALMERTDLYNIAEKVGLKTSNDEIELLRQSYENVLQRLNTAIVKEKRMSMIQLQAQFDALQAQVNPHFIYNILNVISSRGMMNRDEAVCEICDDLAGMLRYSTNVKERYAAVEKEAEYLEAYFKLLKCRYEHKLEYDIDIQPEINKNILPKLVLQQLSENSIAHGFEKQYQIMQLDVKGWQDEKGWYLRIRDNGAGFSEEALEEVKNRIDQIKVQLNCDQRNVELEIGGMGIPSAYARLYLVYADQLLFEIKNYERGAEIFIGISEAQKEEQDYVPNTCSR